MGRLDGKVCVITGAGSGIGQTSARLFAREGARVIVSDVDLGAAETTAEEITKAGGEAVAEHVDVTDQAETLALAERVVQRFERIDVLFNNAGIGGVGDVLETEPELFDRVMRVNVRGVYLMSRAVVPYMIKQRSGSIINMSSCIAEIGLARRVSYAASKGAVLSLTKSMPANALLCESIPVSFTVTNTGKSPARDVKIIDDLPNGLTADGRNSVSFDVGPLAPGLGVRRIVAQSSLRSSMTASPTNRHSVRTCTDSTSGYIHSDSCSAMLPDVFSSH